MSSTKTPVATSPGHLMQLFAERAAAGDLDGLVDLYGPDAVFQPEFGVVLTGHEQIRPALAEFLKLEPQIDYTAEPDVLIAGDIALVTNFWTMTGVAPDGSPVSEGGTSADVLAVRWELARARRPAPQRAQGRMTGRGPNTPDCGDGDER